MEKSLKINVEKEGAPWSFVKSCSIWIFLLPLVGLPFILPSVISHKSPSCLKTWSVHRCFLCQTEFSICLSSFALLRTSLLVTLTWWPELPFAWRFLMCTIYISCFITFLCISSVRFIMYSFLHCGDVSLCVCGCVLGLSVEGIYRRTGQNAIITQLLSLFNAGLSCLSSLALSVFTVRLVVYG